MSWNELLDSFWHRPPARVVLSSCEVHVWRAALDAPPESLRRLHAALAPDERERAARFFFQKDRDHFTAARGLLRELLGGYLGAAPAALRFSYTRYGKPELAGEHARAGLSFNVSHSHGLALFAFTRGRAVGVDVERIRPDVAEENIAEHFFSAGEVARLRALPAQAQARGFFNCWTRKEAYIKALGEGLSHPLDGFDVSLAPGEPAALLHSRTDPREVTRWTLRELPIDEGFAAALAVEGRDWQLKCWRAPV